MGAVVFQVLHDRYPKGGSFNFIGLSVAPYVQVERSARLCNVIIDRGVKIPAGLVVGEDPELDAQRFRRTDNGICLITQPMIDRLGQ